MPIDTTLLSPAATVELVPRAIALLPLTEALSPRARLAEVVSVALIDAPLPIAIPFPPVILVPFPMMIFGPALLAELEDVFPMTIESSVPTKLLLPTARLELPGRVLAVPRAAEFEPEMEFSDPTATEFFPVIIVPLPIPTPFSPVTRTFVPIPTAFLPVTKAFVPMEMAFSPTSVKSFSDKSAKACSKVALSASNFSLLA